jgi:energy-coupling factor transporter transmembrane protein EcfT
MNEDFTLKNVRMRKWLVAIVLAAALFVIFFPPSFWLSGVGVALVVLGMFSNSARTNQWMSWQNEGSLNWFEGWAATTGGLLASVPLVAAVIRSWLS